MHLILAFVPPPPPPPPPSAVPRPPLVINLLATSGVTESTVILLHLLCVLPAGLYLGGCNLFLMRSAAVLCTSRQHPSRASVMVSAARLGAAEITPLVIPVSGGYFSLSHAEELGITALLSVVNGEASRNMCQDLLGEAPIHVRFSFPPSCFLYTWF